MLYFRIFLKFLVTVTSVILIGYLRAYLNPILGDSAPYIVFIPAIIMSTAYGGFKQGMFAVLLSFIFANNFIISPDVFFNLAHAGELSGAFSFFVVGSIVSWFIDISNKSKDEVRKYFTAFEQAGDGIFITDKKGYIKYVNEAFEKMSGFKAIEVMGKTPRIVKSEKQNKDFYENLWKVIKNGKTYRGTFINRKKNGELFYADHTITPIKDSQGKIINYVGIWKDITRQQEMEKRKDEFISIASHELKTPLTSIKGYVQIIGRKLATSKNNELNSYIHRMEIQINNMTNLVFELLDVTRITAGKMRLSKIKFDLKKLMTDAISDMQITTGSEIIFSESHKQISVVADEERISQVINNFLSNAIKYSEKSKKIIVKIKDTNKAVIISVRDFGIGISKYEQSKIFERFYQVKKIKNMENPSFGIGLYIAATIIKQHKGRIWVESREKKGSTFYFSIPKKG